MIFLKLFRESFLFAFDALRQNKLRTILSLLGVTIGIFTIIAVFSAVDTLRNNLQTSINKLIKDVSKMTENHKVKSIHASTKQTQINWYNLDKRDSYLPETLK